MPPKVAKTLRCWSRTSSLSISRLRLGGGFSVEILEERPGILIFEATGKGAKKTFANEAGGHRWQRIPPTEKRGRVQTSTVTVAVLREPTPAELHIPDSDIDCKTTRGSGAGGQHRNTTDSAVQMRHIPTGIRVRCESERSQHINKEKALSLLRAKLLERKESEQNTNTNARRKNQVGSGMRGDKRRTIRTQEGKVVDHITGKRMSLKKYLRGEIEELWQ